MNAPVDRNKRKSSILLIIALVILIIGAVLSLGGSLLMFGISALTIMLPDLFDINLFSTMSSTSMMAVFGALTIPGIVFIAQKLSPKHQETPPEPQDPFDEMPFSRMLAPNTILGATVVLLLIAYLLSTRFSFVQWALPLLQIPAVLAPIYWLYHFITRKYYPRPAKRHWIAFGLDLTIQPILTLILELILMAVFLIPAVLWLTFNPEVLENLMSTLQQFENLQAFSVEEIELIAAGWLENPWVIFFIQMFVAFFVPLIEELLKPILVWRWIKRPLTPMNGFWLGLIGGVSFTIYENFGNLGSISAVNDWYFILFARFGTSILHMATSAFMGWAMMKTFSDRKWLRLLGVYAACVGLHGGWNFFAILQGFAALPMENPPAVLTLSPIASPGLILIAVICTGILLYGSKKIKQPETPSPTSNSEAS